MYLHKKGAVIFAVCRGKISEGLDFSDDAGRSVILIGIPYPMYYEPKTILKRNYLTEKAKALHEGSSNAGREWYNE